MAADPIVGYRTRAKLVVGRGPALGLYGREGDHEVVDIPDCPVLAPSLRHAAAAIRSLLREPGPSAGGALRPDVLRAVDLREALPPGGGEARVLVTLVLDAARRPSPDTIAAAARALRERAPSVSSVALGLRAGRSPRVLGRSPEVVVARTPSRIARPPSGRPGSSPPTAASCRHTASKPRGSACSSPTRSNAPSAACRADR